MWRIESKKLLTGAEVNALLTRSNQEWALDFVAERSGRAAGFVCWRWWMRSRESAPAIEVAPSLRRWRVTRMLERVIALAEHGQPAVRQRAGVHQPAICMVRREKIKLVHIQPGKPMQNGYVESFNGRFRDEFLNCNWFLNPPDAKGKIERWRKEYNTERPHSSLAYRTPPRTNMPAVCSELTSGMAAIPPDRPSNAVNSRAVLAGKGPPPAAP